MIYYLVDEVVQLVTFFPSDMYTDYWRGRCGKSMRVSACWTEEYPAGLGEGN